MMPLVEIDCWILLVSCFQFCGESYLIKQQPVIRYCAKIKRNNF